VVRSDRVWHRRAARPCLRMIALDTMVPTGTLELGVCGAGSATWLQSTTISGWAGSCGWLLPPAPTQPRGAPTTQRFPPPPTRPACAHPRAWCRSRRRSWPEDPRGAPRRHEALAAHVGRGGPPYFPREVLAEPLHAAFPAQTAPHVVPGVGRRTFETTASASAASLPAGWMSIGGSARGRAATCRRL
jgi:hypothetical protein